MKLVLSAIVYWLSMNFVLPPNYDHPHIEYATADEISALRYRGMPGWRPAKVGAAAGDGERSVVAVYDGATKTIYLNREWSGRSPAEMSILIHEMVHHLQNVGGYKFACPQEREQVAYAAQERWLKLFGRDLTSDFEIDRFTLLITTKCPP